MVPEESSGRGGWLLEKQIRRSSLKSCPTRGCSFWLLVPCLIIDTWDFDKQNGLCALRSPGGFKFLFAEDTLQIEMYDCVSVLVAYIGGKNEQR